MMGRLIVLAIGLFIGLVLAQALPEFTQWLPALSSTLTASEPRSPSISGEEQSGIAKLSPDAIAAAGIDIATVEGGTVGQKIIVPGIIVPEANRIAHVAVNLSSIVADLKKNIGDPVERNEVVAVLESRDVADAKSEYLAARLTNELQHEIFERDKALWDRRVSSEQQFLRSRIDAARAKMRQDLAQQKLFTLGLTEAEIASLPEQPEALLRRQDVRSPLSGQIVERKVEVGMVVGRDNLETELFVVADLSRIWVELAVTLEDLPLVRSDQIVGISSRGSPEKTKGKVVFIEPILDKDTRSARVIAEIDNEDGAWRPGSFVNGSILVKEKWAPLAVPVGAIQSMDGKLVVFVRTSDGFQKRQVVLGQQDEQAAEVISGVEGGELIAVSNTFLLKAEMLKGAGED